MNVVTPPSFPVHSNFAVKVYVHGGFALLTLCQENSLIDKVVR